MKQLLGPWVLLSLAACAAAPDASLVFEFTSPVAAGTDAQACKFFVVPAGGFTVHRVSMNLSAGSHHAIAFLTGYQQVPTEDRQGHHYDTSGVFECPDGGGLFDRRAVLGATQSPVASGLDNLPPGMGFPLVPGAVILVNAHHVNATERPLSATIRLELLGAHGVAEATRPGFLDWGHRLLHVPPGATVVERMRCPVPLDVTLLSLQPHMHQYGVDYSVDLLDPAGARVRRLYHGTSWNDLPGESFRDVVSLPAGSFVEFTCVYENSSDRELRYGQRGVDVMCGLMGFYFPDSQRVGRCSSADTPDVSNSAAVYETGGTLACADVAACLVAGPFPSDDDAPAATDAFIDCLGAACPAAAASATGVAKCAMTAARGVCAKACQAPRASPDPCPACVAKACAGPLDACHASTCGGP